MNATRLSLRVWGDFACFTRPEMKVERVSYPIMTPSAARGILEAVFWEPQMYYTVEAICVVKRGRWISFKRNEVQKIVSIGAARIQPILAGGGAEDGTQRNTLALEDVEYIIAARMELSGLGVKKGNQINKYSREFEGRAKAGKCFHRPVLGLREFAADFEYEENPDLAIERRVGEIKREEWERHHRMDDTELGLMLYDVFDSRERAEGFRWLNETEMEALSSSLDSTKGGRKKAGNALPRSEGRLVKPRASFFRASIRNSRMNCDPCEVQVLTFNSLEEKPC